MSEVVSYFCREICCLTCGARIYNFDKPFTERERAEFVAQHRGDACNLVFEEFPKPSVCRPPLSELKA